MSNIENASIDPIANVYFGGKCVSHSITLADGTRISAGVIFPMQETFGTAAPERMQLLQGRCRARLPGTNDWQTFGAGESFEVAGDSSFDIDVIEELHYICHYG